MNHRRYQYMVGEPHKIGFKLVFSKGPVKESVDWLGSLLYPVNLGTMLKNSPHRVIFMFGDLYPGVICVVRQVKARSFHMFDRDNPLHQHAEVEVMLEEYIDQSVDYSQVRGRSDADPDTRHPFSTRGETEIFPARVFRPRGSHATTAGFTR